jgi:hypothetical protein
MFGIDPRGVPVLAFRAGVLAKKELNLKVHL